MVSAFIVGIVMFIGGFMSNQGWGMPQQRIVGVIVACVGVVLVQLALCTWQILDKVDGRS